MFRTAPPPYWRQGVGFVSSKKLGVKGIESHMGREEHRIEMGCGGPGWLVCEVCVEGGFVLLPSLPDTTNGVDVSGCAAACASLAQR